MNNLITPERLTTTDSKLMILGLEQDSNYSNYLAEEAFGAQAVHFQNAFKAFRWLEDCSKTEQLPVAIICDYSFLKKNEFQLLKSIKGNATLAQVPFIALRNEGEVVNSEQAIKLGIDDCYAKPIDWKMLNARVKFLQMYKSVLKERKAGEGDATKLKIPFSKRLVDILIAGGTILALSPILLVIAIIIKLESKGPIIYKSKRVGRGYQVFHFLKFRSMYKDADKRLKELQHLNQYKNEDDNCFVKITNDPRVTRIGRIIRKTSLDELPQLFNVLRGEMSIVGNRPLPLYEAEQLTKDEWAKRFLAPAGITGLWQVTKRGKNDMSTKERMDLDITYAKNFSLWFDIKILMKTIPAMLQEENV